MTEQPQWNRKASTNWPLWAILGIFAFFGLALIIKNNMGPEVDKVIEGVQPSTTLPVFPEVPPAPVQSSGLITNGTYKLGAATPVVDELGADVNAPGVRMLPADSLFVVSSVRMAGDVKWYFVAVKDSAGHQTGWGFISSASLEEQVVLRVH